MGIGHYPRLTYSQETAYKEQIRQRDSYTCQLCGMPGRDVDHIVPYNVSHDSSEDNLRVLCHRCNLIGRRQRKNTNPFKTIDDWYDYLERELASCD